jgi:predicted RNase H-like HicB family nuclease
MAFVVSLAQGARQSALAVAAAFATLKRKLMLVEQSEETAQVRERKMKLKVIIHTGELPNRRCRAEAPLLPGCVSEGDTPEEALANIREAIACYFDATEPPPSGTDRMEEIELSVRQVELLEACAVEPEGGADFGPQPTALRRFLMERGRHESAALVALTTGLFAAIACAALALAPIWIGFLIGYLTMAGFAALVCTVAP